MSKTSAESVPGLYCIYVVQRTTSVSVLTEVPQSRTMQRAHDVASGTPISSLNRCTTIHSPSLRAKTLKKREYLTMQSSVPKIKRTILGQAGNNQPGRCCIFAAISIMSGNLRSEKEVCKTTETVMCEILPSKTPPGISCGCTSVPRDQCNLPKPCLNSLVVLPEGRHLSLRRETVITQTSSMCSTFQCESPKSS